MELFGAIIAGLSIYAFKQYKDHENKKRIVADQKRQLAEEKGRAEKANSTQESFHQATLTAITTLQNLKQQYIANKDVQFAKQYQNLAQSLTKIEAKYRTSDTKTLIKLWTSCVLNRSQANQDFVQRELQRCNQFFSDIDGHSLDTQQRRAVVTDEDNNLVVAGAGSGKTLTIAAKVKYLVEERGVRPENILLISFTRKSALEMKERVVEGLKIPVAVKTFHSLGLEIIAEAQNEKPSIQSEGWTIIQRFFQIEMPKQPDLALKIFRFYASYLTPILKREQFDNLGEYINNHKIGRLEPIKVLIEKEQNKETLNYETVKSIEELIIANVLFTHSVEYEYERKYPFKTSSKEFSQYKPDFYLPEKNLYLEHFGINKEKRVPWLPKFEEKKYLEGIDWKRELHLNNQTNMIETYSYFHSEGRLITELKKLLEGHSYTLKPISVEQLLEYLESLQQAQTFKELTKLFTSFLSLFKANHFTEKNIQEMKIQAKGENPYNRERIILFLEIFEHLFQYYQNQLVQNDDIDFNDMITQATDILNKGHVQKNYQYIIIDEYQDISISKYKLLKSIKNQTEAKIIAVGDDWQSIYRFTGSDISIFSSFEELFGVTELLKIEQTYRNSQELIDIAGKFILQNPKQIRKKLHSKKQLSEPISVVLYNKSQEKALIEALQNLSPSEGEKIFLLGRNNFDCKFLEESQYFTIKQTNNQKIIKSPLFPNIEITFLTVHSSKGLEADQVIIINAKNDLLGFPNQISDDPLLDLLLTKSENYNYSEERRLFYVALTRTKNKTIILAPLLNQSIFVKELIKEHHVPEILLDEAKDIHTSLNCPRCETGQLVERKGRSSFLGCNNYPSCDLTIGDIKIQLNKIHCPWCGSYMKERTNRKTGELFYGCVNYPQCNNTISI